MSASNTRAQDREQEATETAASDAEERTAAEAAEEKAAAPDAASDSGVEDEPQSEDAERLRALEKEAAELRDQALRARAEVENVLRRTQREKQDIAAYAISDFARALLPVADNLRRAVEAVPDEAREQPHVKALLDGVEMTEKELLSAFEKHGIRKIAPEGEKFDHNYHQAMAEVDAPDQAPGTVVEVYQPGYVIKERLLRPAMVTVARKGSEAGQGENVDTTA